MKTFQKFTEEVVKAKEIRTYRQKTPEEIKQIKDKSDKIIDETKPNVDNKVKKVKTDNGKGGVTDKSFTNSFKGGVNSNSFNTK